MSCIRIAFAVLVASPLPLSAADWPQWMGPSRDAIWTETGILKTFPEGGPKVLWRKPISDGYSGPAVASQRVYVTDRVLDMGARNPSDPFNDKPPVPSKERVICLDARNGKELWMHQYASTYQISFPAGPRCTPTVDNDKVYTLGAMGDFICLNAMTGEVIWSKNFLKDFHAKLPKWGFCAHPLVYKNLVICMVGGEGSVVMAFDKETGKEKWRSLSAPELGYCPPTLITVGGKDQIVVWHSRSVNGIEPDSGKPLWSVGLTPAFDMAIMAPRQYGDRLFVAGIGGVSVVLKLDPSGKSVTPLWEEPMAKGKEMATRTRGLYPINMTPFIDNGTIYGVDHAGMLRAVDLDSGKRHWFSFKPVIGIDEEEHFAGAKYGTAFIVKNGDRYFLFSETGELIIAKLSPEKYEELSRAKVLEPTGTAFSRKVVWSHPAFSGKCAFIRNDTEIICVSLVE